MRGAAVVMVVTLVLFACADRQTSKPLSEPGEKLYTLKGKILARDNSDNTIRVDHDAIAGYMEAMTMDYSVRGTQVSALPADGSRVTATLHVTNKGYWLTGVKKVQ